MSMTAIPVQPLLLEAIGHEKLIIHFKLELCFLLDDGHPADVLEVDSDIGRIYGLGHYLCVSLLAHQLKCLSAVYLLIPALKALQFYTSQLLPL